MIKTDKYSKITIKNNEVLFQNLNKIYFPDVCACCGIMTYDIYKISRQKIYNILEVIKDFNFELPDCETCKK